MRTVTLTKETFDQTFTQVGPRSVITAEDTHTGELVTFGLEDGTLVNELIIKATRGEVITLPLADFQVISVEAVRGEWDSPGTSEEV